MANAGNAAFSADELQRRREDGGEVAEDVYAGAKQSQVIYDLFKQTAGLDDEKTLNAAFDLYNQLIQLYKLTECDTLLEEVKAACKAKGGEFYIKCIQAFAFLRYKQFRVDEAIVFFEEMHGLVGESAALMENMGHAYNNVNREDKAEACFKRALELMEMRERAAAASAEAGLPPKKQEAGSKGGSLLGLGVMYLHQGKKQLALETLLKGLGCYQAEHKADHSIVAKSSMYVGEAYEALNDFEKSEHYYKESVRIFRLTCGDESPLTSSALIKLGKVCMRQGAQSPPKKAQGFDALQEAFMRTCTQLDPHSLRLNTVAELIILLYNACEDKKQIAGKYTQWCGTALTKLQCRLPGNKLPEDGNAAVFFKTYAELCVYDQQYALAAGLFEQAHRVLLQLNEPGVEQLREECRVCLQVMRANPNLGKAKANLAVDDDAD